MTTELSLAARCRVQEVFNFEYYVNAYDALYKKLGACPTKSRCEELELGLSSFFH